MGILARWNLGAKALAVANWAAEVARAFDAAAVLAIVMKVVEIERTRRGIPGAQKLTELLDWMRGNYPSAIGVSSVASFVNSLVALMNALAVFRK